LYKKASFYCKRKKDEEKEDPNKEVEDNDKGKEGDKDDHEKENKN